MANHWLHCCPSPPLQAAPAGSSTAHSSWNVGEVYLLDKQSGVKTAAYYYNWVTPGVPAVVYESSNYQVGCRKQCYKAMPECIEQGTVMARTHLCNDPQESTNDARCTLIALHANIVFMSMLAGSVPLHCHSQHHPAQGEGAAQRALGACHQADMLYKTSCDRF
jgi:hypothetical protein